ncbi:DNA processing protein DprA [Pseudoclavibacter endophyticus]|uniref:DNA-processing protein DprA n=1 Tax=Pseudoclavibacter endophyticus TaxID=1778590 RepID=A0A6H9WBC0_9MICO|nr:DNA-processing protein DprA [Pseudoclavibacter endophyticus]KAB1647893.1 DNA-processing protein DprA [Pseudoclavibacter endophyticus]GGA73681.1 DNA processing protein DprA [Pseudoclavibacter endophyticus]
MTDDHDHAQPLLEVLERIPRPDTVAWRRSLAANATSLAAMGRSDEEADLERRLAAVAWSSIAEPGDLDAGELTASIGAVAGARLLFCVEPHAALRAALAAVGADGALSAIPGRLERAVDRWRPRADYGRVSANVHSGITTGARVVMPGDRDWPAGCDDLGAGRPHALWVRGDRGLADIGVGSLADRPAALVGSRSCSPYGERVSTEFADGLADRGSTIVSGGAYGIDVTAHRSALAGTHPTVAVLAGGADRLYPAGNADTLRRIMRGGGAVIAELPCGTAPTRSRFLQRNRVIAAMSAATIVVEAGYRSGALNTAGHAGELGRPLGAVPGSITTPTSVGCHRLIREFNATLVAHLDHALELVHGEIDAHPQLALPGLEVRTSGPNGIDGLDDDAVRVWEALQPRRGQSAGDLARRAGLSELAVRGALAALELDGRALGSSGSWRRAAG